MSRARQGELVLLGVTLIWGTTFVGVREMLSWGWPPFGLLAARFGLAALPFLPSMLRPGALDAATLRRGTILGFLLFLGFGFQTLGLQWTTEGRSAFFTAFSTVLVPFFALVFLRRPPVSGTWLAILSGGAGIVLLLGQGVEGPPFHGDLFTIGCAVAFAVQILVLDAVARGSRILPLTGVEMASTAVFGLVAAYFAGEDFGEVTAASLPLLLYLGIAATALTLWGQVFGQQRTTATRAAFLFALEPAFAAFFAWIVRGHGLGAAEWIGGGLVVLASIVADRSFARFSNRLGGAGAGSRRGGDQPEGVPPAPSS